MLVVLLASIALHAAPSPPSPQPVAIEPRLARELRLTVGDTFRVSTAPGRPGLLARVAAIYEPAPDPATVLRPDLHLRLHLADLASLLGQPDRVDRFGLVVARGANADTVAARLDRRGFGFRAAASATIAEESSATFRVVSRFHRAIAVITVCASAVFLLCVMLLKVEERRLDAAVMRFVGVRRRTVFGALLLEAACIAAIGSVAGIVIAAGAAWVVNAYYRAHFETPLLFAVITPGVVGFSVSLSILLGLGAGSLAALRLVRTPPLALWRRG